MIKNTAGQFVSFQMIDKTNGDDIISGTPTVHITKDNGVQYQGAGTILNKGEGNWLYVTDITDTNAYHIAFTMVLTGAVSQTVNVYTRSGVVPPTSDEIYTYFTSSGNEVTFRADTAPLITLLNDIPTVNEFNNRTLPMANYFNPANDTVVNVGTVQLTMINNDMRGTNDANTVVPLTQAYFDGALPANFGDMTVNNFGEVTTSNPSTNAGGDTADVVYNYFTNMDRQKTFRADLTGLEATLTTIQNKTDQLTYGTPNVLDVNVISGVDNADAIYTYFTSLDREDLFKADLTTLNNLDASAIQAAVSTSLAIYDGPTRAEATADKVEIINHGDGAWTTGGSTVTAGDIYTYFTDVGREVPFQADVLTALASYNVPTRLEATQDKDAIIARGDVAWTGSGGGSGGGTTFGFDAGAIIERSVDDAMPIYFSWPVSGATITGAKRIDGGVSSATVGLIAQTFTENGVIFYMLDYDVADRPSGEGVALYKFTDGTNTQLVALRISPSGSAGKNTKQEIRDWVGGLWTDESNDSYELTITDIP